MVQSRNISHWNYDRLKTAQALSAVRSLLLVVKYHLQLQNLAMLLPWYNNKSAENINLVEYELTSRYSFIKCFQNKMASQKPFQGHSVFYMLNKSSYRLPPRGVTPTKHVSAGSYGWVEGTPQYRGVYRQLNHVQERRHTKWIQGSQRVHLWYM